MKQHLKIQHSYTPSNRNVSIQSNIIDKTIADTSLYNHSHELLRRYMSRYKTKLGQNISTYKSRNIKTFKKQNATAAFLKSALCITSLSTKYKFTFILIRWNYDDAIIKTLHKVVCAMHGLLYGQSCIHKFFRSNDCNNVGKPSYFDFTFVSDPFQRALRAWKDHILNMRVFKRYKRRHADKHDGNSLAHRISMITKMCTFEDFLNFAPRCKVRSLLDEQWPKAFLSNQMKATIVDKIGKVETFEEDMRDVLTQIFGEKIFKKMKRSNITLELPSREKLNLELTRGFQYNQQITLAIIEKIFVNDLRLLNLL